MTSHGKIVSVSTRLATEADKHIPAYDNTKLSAINTCPTWGIIRYDMHKTFKSGGRALALEMGSAMHELFAAIRLYQLYRYQLQPLDPALAKSFFEYHGARLFGDNKFDNMVELMKHGDDDRAMGLNFALQAMFNYGYYDDPSDKRRTLSNMEEAGIVYYDRWNFQRNPIWVRDINDPKADVGIEIPFDIVLTYTFEGGVQRQYRFIGKFDGLHTRDGQTIVGENKTASRLDDAWQMSFEMATQVTGYCLAGSVWTGDAINRAIVWGLTVPLPKSDYSSGLITVHVNRDTHHFERWFKWFLHTVEICERYRLDLADAPKYTHSCNRYFRPCSMIPYCVADDEEQKQILEEMVIEEWSPLHEKAGD